MDFKLIGSILLIVGTSIGAGMLALPIATAELGFIGSMILLLSCWFVMTAGAFLLLEVNLWLPQNSNLISMARATIGPHGQIMAWAAYLLLLYSLLCAYIAGGSNLFVHLLQACQIQLPVWAASVSFTFLFGAVVYIGIRSVDYVNRGLMCIKLSAYVLLIVFLAPLISADKLAAGDLSTITHTGAITVTITSFGYAAIIPSLRVYFGGDIKKLKKAIFIGSLIPLICYLVWDAAIMGVVPLEGPHGLKAVLQSKGSASDLVTTLSALAANQKVAFFAKLFTSICVVTSFLGVGLCLVDFMADGFSLEKKGASNLFIHAICFLPPLLIVLRRPYIFVKALEYAGIYSIILLIFIPAWMAFNGRYKKKMAKGYRLGGGKPLLVLMSVISIFMIVKAIAGM